MENTIYKRTIIGEIEKYLPTEEIIVLHGARQVGKTSILIYLQNQLQNQGKKTFYIDLEDSRFVQILEKGVDEFIKLISEQGFVFDQKNKIYVFIDEIQYLSNPSPFLKLMIDHHPEIKLIISGSSSFNIKNKFSDSLVGRTVNFDIHNLSFAEFLEFKEYQLTSKDDLTDKKITELQSYYQEYVLAGGYPKIVLTSDLEMKEKYLQQIIDTYIRKDIRDLAKIRDVQKFNQLLEILASQNGQILNLSELADTCNLTRPTVEQYLFLLEETYIIRLVRPFYKNIRSEISKAPKIYFYDTGLAHLLWLKSLPKEILGQSFESSIFAELAKKYGVTNFFYWRTTDNKEIDFILQDKNDLISIEAKLNNVQYKKTAQDYFAEVYQPKESNVVSLKGKFENKRFIYPWQL